MCEFFNFITLKFYLFAWFYINTQYRVRLRILIYYCSLFCHRLNSITKNLAQYILYNYKR